jgi:putative membrane protein
MSLLLKLLTGVFVVFWSVMAISPTDRSQWLLENILVILAAALLAFTYRKMKLSDPAYALIALFLCLHTYAAHYTYQATPVDMWLKAAFHTHRSYFDRFVHFMFGLLLLYPLREVLLRILSLRAWWSYAVPLAFLVSFSALLEMGVAAVAGQIGQDYVGLQGDPFDSEKDMALSLTGALLAGVIAGIGQKKKKSVASY